MDTISLALKISDSKDLKVVDKRDQPSQDLAQILRDELDSLAADTLLWTAKRPKKNWHEFISGWRALTLSSSALFEQIFWVRDSLSLPLPPEIQQEQETLLNSYPELFRRAGPVLEDQLWLEYRETLLKHVEREEKQLFPPACKVLPVERSLKELQYEHQGLKRGLSRMPEVLDAARSGVLSSREREKFDLDYYHLLEHHTEREALAVYPLLIFLSKG